MKIEVVPQQDAVEVEFNDTEVSITQSHSYDGQDGIVSVSGKANVVALIGALQQALEGMV